VLAISAAEAATGIPRETLRMWERRYGFPAPARAASGERLYRPEEIGKLTLIRKLLNVGFRPHSIVPMPVERLRRLADESGSARLPEDSAGPGLLGTTLQLLRSDDSRALGEWMDQAVARRGLEHFILHVARPLASAMGEAWESGSLAVFEEHILTQHLERAIHAAMRPLPVVQQWPRVLLATVDPERHTLGLLMVNALLALVGTPCVWLGPTPLDELAKAASFQHADAVALSFSAYFPRQKVGLDIRRLRDALPAATAIWVGGRGTAHVTCAGVTRMTLLEEAPGMVRVRGDPDGMTARP